MRRHLPSLALFLLAACSSRAETTSPPRTEPAPQAPESAAPSPAGCDQRVEELEAWLATVEWEPPSFVSKDALPELPGELAPWSKPPGRAPMLMVQPGSITLEGRKVETGGQTLAQVAKDLGAELLARRKAAGSEGFDAIFLIASRDARWEHVVAAADGAAQAGLAVDVAFETPRKLPRQPGPSPLGDRLAATPGDPVAYAQVSEELFAACAPAISVFGNVATGDPEARLEALVQGIPRALRECSCKPGPDDARTWFWHVVFGGDAPGLRVVRLRVTGGDARGALVRAAAGDTWQQVLPKAIDAARPGAEDRPVRFEVQPGRAGK